MQKEITLINDPRASSGLGNYIASALTSAGCAITRINPLGSKLHRLGPVIRSIRLNHESMWKARWENVIFSSRAWDRNTKYVGKILEKKQLMQQPLLLVAKEFYPHPDYQHLTYSIFTHTNMRLCLREKKPWVPPRRDMSRYIDRETKLFNHAERIFVGATYTKDSLVSEYGVPADNIIVAGGGANPYFEENMATDLPDAFSNQLLFVGWDFGMKGGGDLLKSFEIVRKDKPELSLLVVGPDQSQWVDQDGVTWVGSVSSKDELIKLYRSSDLFVMPSLCDSFGFVFLEAMTQGLPCIGADVNAMPEIIRDGETGYIVPANNPDALASAILRYYDRCENRREMGSASQARIREKYRWGLVAEQIVANI